MLPLSRWHQINNNMIRFRIGKKIANGAFGQLRLVKDLLTGEVGGEVNHANQAKLQLIVFQKLFSEKSEINYWFIIYDKKEISEKYWNFSNAFCPKAPPTTLVVVLWYINVSVPKRKWKLWNHEVRPRDTWEICIQSTPQMFCMNISVKLKMFRFIQIPDICFHS